MLGLIFIEITRGPLYYIQSTHVSLEYAIALVKDWLLDDSLHETFEIRKKIFLSNLIDFNPLHTFRQSFTGISPLKYVFLPFFISKHISLFLFIATKHDVICKTGQIIMHMHYYCWTAWVDLNHVIKLHSNTRGVYKIPGINTMSLDWARDIMRDF